MREVMRGFRQKIKLIETQAGEQIDKIMAKPTLHQGNLQQLNSMVIKVTMQKSMDALKEGATFGAFIKEKINDFAG